MLEQECIPVGCVPPASVAISPAMHTPTMHAPCHTPPAMHVLTMHVPLATPPLLCMPPSHHAPPCRQTNTCENITFANFVDGWYLEQKGLIAKKNVSRKFQFANFQTRIVAGCEDIHNTRETEAFAIIIALTNFIQPIPHYSTVSLSITRWRRYTTRGRLHVIRHQFIRARRSVLIPHNDGL